jgi:hypothetical protein
MPSGVLGSTTITKLAGRCAMQIGRIASFFPWPLALLNLFALAETSSHAQVAALPGIGGSIVIDEIKVTLLDARSLSLDEYRKASGDQSPDAPAAGSDLPSLLKTVPAHQTFLRWVRSASSSRRIRTTP